MLDRYDENTILGYIEGDLSTDEQAAFEQLMADDAQLRSLVQHLIDDRDQLRRVPAVEAPVAILADVTASLEREMLLDKGTAAGPYKFPTWARTVSAIAAMVILAVALTWQFDPFGWRGANNPVNPDPNTFAVADDSTKDGTDNNTNNGIDDDLRLNNLLAQGNDLDARKRAGLNLADALRQQLAGQGSQFAQGESLHNQVDDHHMLRAVELQGVEGFVSIELASADMKTTRRALQSWANENDVVFVTTRQQFAQRASSADTEVNGGPGQVQPDAAPASPTNPPAPAIADNNARHDAHNALKDAADAKSEPKDEGKGGVEASGVGSPPVPQPTGAKSKDQSKAKRTVTPRVANGKTPSVSKQLASKADDAARKRKNRDGVPIESITKGAEKQRPAANAIAKEREETFEADATRGNASMEESQQGVALAGAGGSNADALTFSVPADRVDEVLAKLEARFGREKLAIQSAHVVPNAKALGANTGAESPEPFGGESKANTQPKENGSHVRDEHKHESKATPVDKGAPNDAIQPTATPPVKPSVKPTRPTATPNVNPTPNPTADRTQSGDSVNRALKKDDKDDIASQGQAATQDLNNTRPTHNMRRAPGHANPASDQKRGDNSARVIISIILKSKPEAAKSIEDAPNKN